MRDYFSSPTGIRLRNRVGGLLLLIALLGSPLLTRISVDNSLARWVEQDTQRPGTSTTPQEGFEDLVTVLIQVSGDSLFSEDALDTLVVAFEDLEAIPDVIRVEGVPGIFRDQFGLEDIDALKDEMQHSPYFQKFYVSPDLQHMGLFVLLSPEKSGHSDRSLLEEITAITHSLEEDGFAISIVGPVVMNAELDRLSLQEAERLFPLALIVSSLILFVLLRSFKGTLVATFSAGLTLTLLMECMAFSGYSMNMVTVSLPPLIWVLSLSTSIHLLNRFLLQYNERNDLATSIQGALSETAFPNTFASLTTALGFLSLCTSEMVPVQEMGLFVALGMCITISVNLCVTPLLLQTIKPKQRERKTIHPHETPMKFRPRTILLMVSAAVIFIIPGLFKIQTESNPLSMFPPDSHVHQQYAALSKELAAPCTLETIVQLPLHWQEPETWPVIEQIVDTLESRDIAIKTLSPLDGLRLIHQWDSGDGVDSYRLPETREQTEKLLRLLDDSSAELLGGFVRSSGTEIRIITFVNELDSGLFLEYVDEVNKKLSTLPSGYSGYTTGTVLRIVRAQNNLVTQQYTSFGLAFGVIFICMFFGLRSWKLLLLSIPPNLLPIATVFGVMGYCDIPLDIGSVMVASVVLGIGVDDTVHMLVALSRNAKQHSSQHSIIQSSLQTMTPALTTTTSVIGSGFLVLTLSNFTPLVHFGFLASMAIFVALWADLRLVPAILLLASSRKDHHE